MAVNAASFGVAAVLLGRLGVRHDPAPTGDGEEPARLRDDPRFLALIAVNGILALCTMLLGIGLPVYVVDALPAAIAPERGRGRYLSYWQYSFTLAQIAVPAFFAGLFEVRADLPWLVVAGLATVAAGAVLALERGLREPVRV